MLTVGSSVWVYVAATTGDLRNWFDGLAVGFRSTHQSMLEIGRCCIATCDPVA